jgi:hypothetical protein
MSVVELSFCTARMLPPQRTGVPMWRSGAARTATTDTGAGAGVRMSCGTCAAQPSMSRVPAAAKRIRLRTAPSGRCGRLAGARRPNRHLGLGLGLGRGGGARRAGRVGGASSAKRFWSHINHLRVQ